MGLKGEPGCVAILMATYNGEKYLPEQLASFERQTYQNWVLLASDDGSKDKTLDILREFQAKHGSERVQIISGPRQGFQNNFLSMMYVPDIDCAYYAFSDQDDIWMEDKLARAVQHLKACPETKPALYYTPTLSVDAEGRSLGRPPMVLPKPNFRHALVQNTPPGNTLTINRKFRDMLKEERVLNVPSHDWWIYIFACVINAQMIADPLPSVYYRQHGANVWGDNRSLKARLYRLYLLMTGEYAERLLTNVKTILGLKVSLSADNQYTLDEFYRALTGNLGERIGGLFRAGVYRKPLFHTLAILMMVILHRLPKIEGKE